MTSRNNDDRYAAEALLLLFLLFAYLLKGYNGASISYEKQSCHQVFVEISGNINFPGVYFFCSTPDLKQLVENAGGLSEKNAGFCISGDMTCKPGSAIEISKDFSGRNVIEKKISAFYKTTLGMPLSINSENIEGLTSLPGIGYRIASEIVKERSKRNGFQTLDEIRDVRGINTKLFKEISPFITL